MTRDDIGALCRRAAEALLLLLPPDVHLILVLAVSSRNPAAPDEIHAATHGTLTGESAVPLLRHVLNASEAHAEALIGGRMVDATPKGPAS